MLVMGNKDETMTYSNFLDFEEEIFLMEIADPAEKNDSAKWIMKRTGPGNDVMYYLVERKYYYSSVYPFFFTKNRKLGALRRIGRLGSGTKKLGSAMMIGMSNCKEFGRGAASPRISSRKSGSSSGRTEFIGWSCLGPRAGK